MFAVHCARMLTVLPCSPAQQMQLLRAFCLYYLHLRPPYTAFVYCACCYYHFKAMMAPLLPCRLCCQQKQQLQLAENLSFLYKNGGQQQTSSRRQGTISAFGSAISL
jgi:hypothetical protein